MRKARCQRVEGTTSFSWDVRGLVWMFKFSRSDLHFYTDRYKIFLLILEEKEQQDEDEKYIEDTHPPTCYILLIASSLWFQRRRMGNSVAEPKHQERLCGDGRMISEVSFDSMTAQIHRWFWATYVMYLIPSDTIQYAIASVQSL